MMNFFALIFAFLIVSAVKCDDLYRKCKLGTRIPHPYHCGKYMVCGKTRGEYRCEDSMLYNHKIRACDRPENVECTRVSLNSMRVASHARSILPKAGNIYI